MRLERRDLLRRVALDRETNGRFIVPPARTPGLHLSGLLRYIAVKSKITTFVEDAAEEDAIERGHHPLRWFLGIAVEEALASLYPDMTWQPGEIMSPVIMTPDGISYDEYPIIEEFKARRYKRFKSGKEMLSKKWAWAHQGMGECLGVGTPYVRWHVFSMFEFPDPSYIKYLIKFSDEELAGMERMIEVNREGAIREGYAE